KINLKMVQSKHIPSLSGYAGYSFQSPIEKLSAFNNEDNWYTTSFVGVKLSVPIFEGNSLKNKAAQGKIEMEQIAIGQRDLKNELASNYKSAMQKLSTNRLLESKLSENRKVSESIFAATNEQYREGLKSFTDVLNAQAEYNVSCLSWINALFQIKTAELEILKISGNIQILNR
ncbi:MAG TPA: TolC family protein, partial [Prolixibacteraceae bacterium]|nr:TolC family protein [Prolixibacteraceae bacterium]